MPGDSWLERGDIYELKPPTHARGHEQRGARYAVILQSTDLPLSTVIVAPTSTGRVPRSFRPLVSVRGVETCVLIEAMASVSPEHRLGHRVGRVTKDELLAIDRAVRVVVDV